jgi:NTE family protein
MGAIVAATYALREDWYEALLSVDLSASPDAKHGWPSPGHGPTGLRRAWNYAQTTWSLVTGWGAPDEVIEASRIALHGLLGSQRFEDARVPVKVCATDLRSGSRVVLGGGPAAPAVYASSALAGVFRPLEDGVRLLMDGVYADNAPVDVAQAMGAPVVLAVDPSQGAGAESITNGLQAVMRAMEVCHLMHAHARLATADLVLRPAFGRPVEVLDFDARRECVAAGVRAVRADLDSILRVLDRAQP